jgi:hypothetical protein
VGEAARGGQLIANQGQEWMGICPTSKRRWFSKYKEGLSYIKGNGMKGEWEARGRVS